MLVSLSLIHFVVYGCWGWLYSSIWSDISWHFVIVAMYILYALTLTTHWAGHRKFRGFKWWTEAHMGHHLQ